MNIARKRKKYMKEDCLEFNEQVRIMDTFLVLFDKFSNVLFRTVTVILTTRKWYRINAEITIINSQSSYETWKLYINNIGNVRDLPCFLSHQDVFYDLTTIKLARMQSHQDVFITWQQSSCRECTYIRMFLWSWNWWYFKNTKSPVTRIYKNFLHDILIYPNLSKERSTSELDFDKFRQITLSYHLQVIWSYSCFKSVFFQIQKLKNEAALKLSDLL